MRGDPESSLSETRSDDGLTPDAGPFETVSAGSGPDALRGVLLVCDHASNRVPPFVGDLGLPAADMARHIAYDVGARGVTLGLAARLGSAAVLSRFSRLAIDPNRGEDDPTLVMRLADGSIVPGNRHIGPEDIAERVARLHRPYHAAVSAAIDRIEADGQEPALVSVHSFTPQFRGRQWRPWHIGLLWDRDDRLVRPMFESLSREQGLVVGDNEPYSGQLAGDCMWTHGTRRGIAHLLIEIRNDLIGTASEQAAWAERLAPHVRAAVAGLG